MPTTGALMAMPPVLPQYGAPPKAKMPPSEATSQYPLPPGHGGDRRFAPHGAEEAGVTEGEDPATGGHEPVAPTVGRRHDVGDRGVEGRVGHGAVAGHAMGGHT